MKKFSFALILLLLVAIVSACGNSEKTEDSKTAALNTKKLVIGVTAGPHEEIAEKVAEIAKKEGLDIELKVFSDYVLPNTALSEGSLDANSFQHVPYLKQYNKDKGDDLVAVGKTILSPMGIYSKKYKNFDEIPNGSKIAIPNDPTNGSRALEILAKEGFITLKDTGSDLPTIYDIDENKKNYKFIELEAAQIPKQLSEVAAAAINTNFALEAGLNPKKDAILVEGADSIYANQIVVRKENKNDPTIKKFVKAYHSDEIKKFIEEKYEGSLIPSW
ncbi:MetQ/NlpA family ABC transporter substrate-binding protein [Rummeliibacillus sp. JY-2-4R]